jgi:hypothetical protein
MTTNNSWNSQDPVQVAKGGTGQSTLTTPNGILAAGTTATGAIQNIGTGSAGQVLTSNGTGLPSFQAASSGAIVLLHTITFNNTASSYDITPYLSATYETYKIIGTNIQCFAGGSDNVCLRVSTNGGSTFITTGYVFQAAVQNCGVNALQSFTGTDGFVMGYLDQNSTADRCQFEATLSGYLSPDGVQITALNANRPTQKVLTSYGYYIGTVNGLQILNLAGTNFPSGKVSIYGIAQ